MNKIFCFIFARGGSERIPNKNLKKIGKFTLLQRSINCAKKIKRVDKIFVSSDSKRILNHAKKNYAEIIKRPNFLGTKNSNEFQSWKHAIKYVENNNLSFDYFLSLPTTSPMRKVSDIDKMINKFKKSNFDLILCITKTNRFPNYNMVLKLNNKVQPIIKNNKLKKENMYNLTTIGYFAKKNFILRSNNIFNGKVGFIIVPRERALDIDDFYDLKIAKFLLNEK